jgi:hypothetical protein
LVIDKEDRRFDPPQSHRAIETAALSQTVIVRIVRTALEDELKARDVSLADIERREQRQRNAVRKLLR